MADRRQDTPGTGDGEAQATPAARGGRPADRDARLKAALQANIARRKARSRALDAQDGENGPTHEQPEEQ